MLGINAFLPFAGDRTSILPFILIGAAVILILGFIIYQSINKKDHSQYTEDDSEDSENTFFGADDDIKEEESNEAEYSNDSNDSDDTEE
jgi:hypothetical protein